MDLATLIGLISSFVVVIVAIVMGGNALGFVDIPSMMIVIGGAITVTLTRFTFGDLIKSLGAGCKVAFAGDGPPARELIEKLSELADIVRRNGPLGLEAVQIDDPFMAKGVRYIADGYEEEYIRESLELDRDNLVERITSGVRAFKAIGDAAPAFGMIGTLVGLVQMLAQMDDPSAIGPSMAIALLTTLYGALVSNLIAIPIHDKLNTKLVYIELSQSLMIDGLILVRQNKSPAILKDLLVAYLPENDRTALEEAA